jgi:hypothetical protein
MNQKNDASKDVNLTQSPSGTWTMSAQSKPTFKPWQRLWLVAGIMYLLILAGTCYLIMPNQENIEKRMVASVIEEVHRYDGMAFAGEAPSKIIENARLRGYPTWIKEIRTTYRIGPEGNAGFEKIDREYREAVSALPVKHVLAVLIAIAVWVVPMAVLYAFGFVVDWIKRGAHVAQGG